MNWHVQVFGRLALHQGSQVITHFESSRVAVLLAYLALFGQRSHPREELCELLWPEIAPEVSRQRLRQALYTLRHQLEPPGVPPGSVLIADRHAVRLNPTAFTCDAVEFERLVRKGHHAEARALYIGDLLPGYYEDWLLLERYRLEELYASLPTPSPPAQPTETSLVSPALAEIPPPASWQPAHNLHVSLPSYLTEFLGREEELHRLAAQLSCARLLTLTGLGGVGKTRLATTVGRSVAFRYDTVIFVPLADHVAPSQLPETIRLALGLPATSASTLEQITTVFADSRVLMILDNFEQLVEAGGGVVVETLLSRLPHLTCLVTSRRILGVEGEQEFPLSPLPLPSSTESLSEMAQNPGVTLFVRRAQAARPGFHLTEQNRVRILALCTALDGIPLALELAASRIRALTPAEMQVQIQDRFDWLTRSGPGADKEPRQRSLRAALEWSWRLLSPSQQRFIAACSVFHGGWTIEAARQVCEATDARERLEALVTDSLVVSTPTAEGTTRFRMLETVRAFAQEQLSPDEQTALRSRHLAVFLEAAQHAAGHVAALQPEADNLLAALHTAIDHADASSAFALCTAVDEGWMAYLGAPATLTLLQRALRLPGGDARKRVRTLNLAAYLAITAGALDQALSLASEALALTETAHAGRAIALTTRAKVALMRTEPLEQIEAWLAEALTLSQNSSDPRTHASALRLLGMTAVRQDRFDAAEDCFARALQISQQAGDRQGVIYALARQAIASMQQSHLDRALALNQQCQQLAVEAGDRVYEAEMYQNLAAIYASQSRWHDSLEAAQECLRRNQLLGNTYILTLTLWNLSEPLARLHQEAAAIRLLGFAAQFWVEHFAPLNANDHAFCRMIRDLAASALHESQITTLWKEGEHLTLSQALILALNE